MTPDLIYILFRYYELVHVIPWCIHKINAYKAILAMNKSPTEITDKYRPEYHEYQASHAKLRHT